MQGKKIIIFPIGKHKGKQLYNQLSKSTI